MLSQVKTPKKMTKKMQIPSSATFTAGCPARRKVSSPATAAPVIVIMLVWTSIKSITPITMSTLTSIKISMTPGKSLNFLQNLLFKMYFLEDINLEMNILTLEVFILNGQIYPRESYEYVCMFIL